MRTEVVHQRMRYEYSTSTSIYMKATLPESDEILGYVQWDPPSSSLPPPPPHSLNNVITVSEYLVGADRALFRSMNEEHNKALRSITGGREHWYLSGIVVDPNHQGKGVGSALLDWGAKRADEAGVGIFCLSSAEVGHKTLQVELMIRAGHCIPDVDFSINCGVTSSLRRETAYASGLYGGTQPTRL